MIFNVIYIILVILIGISILQRVRSSLKMEYVDPKQAPRGHKRTIYGLNSNIYLTTGIILDVTVLSERAHEVLKLCL